MPLIKTQIYMWSPNDKIDQEFIKFLEGATRKLRLADYSFNLKAATDTLIEKHRAGVDVQLVLDHSQAAGHTEVPLVKALKEAGIPMMVGTSPAHKIMHDKFAVKDDRVVFWGSWNFTQAATLENNVAEITNDTELASAFTQRWQEMWDWIEANEKQPEPGEPGEVIHTPNP